MNKTIFIVLSVCAISLFAQQQESRNMSLISRWANGICNAVATTGDTVYFNNGGYFEIVDFTDPFNPVEISKTLLEIFPADIVIDSNHVYISHYPGKDGISVIDISDLSNPFEVSQCDSIDAYKIYVSKNNLYAAAQEDGIAIFDISVPTNPQNICTIDTIGRVINVKVKGDLAYISTTDNGFWIYNVSNPIDPFELYHFDLENWISDITVVANYAYVLDRSENLLRIFNISDPVNSYEIGNINLGYNPRSVTVKNDYLFIAHSLSITILDISMPTIPIIIGMFSDYDNTDISIGNNILFTASDDHLGIVNISNPDYPTQVGKFNTSGRTDNVAIYGKYVYSASGEKGIKIIDISDPINLTDVGYINPGVHPEILEINSEYLYLRQGGSSGILEIYDISCPIEPKFILSINALTPKNISVRDGYAYIIGNHRVYNTSGGWGGEEGFYILDITDIQSIETDIVGSIDIAAKDLAVSNDFAFLAGGFADDYLHIINISDPINPIEVKSYFEDNITSVEVSGNYAYVSVGYRDYEQNGIKVLDISYPPNPNEIGYYDTGDDTPTNLEVSGKFLYFYVGNGLGGIIKALDISDHNNIEEVGYFNFDFLNDFKVKDNYVLAANGSLGFSIIRNELAEPVDNEIDLSVSEKEAYPGDSVLVNLFVQIPPDSSYSSFELSLSGYLGILEFIEIVTDSSILETLDWAFEINETDSMLIIASASTENINGSGILFSIKYSIPDTARPGFIPINIESALFGESDVTVNLESGGIQINPLPLYGDVSLNGEIHAEDASLVLKYLVDYITLIDEKLINADVTSDSTVSALDASLILQYVVGIIDTLPYDTSVGSLIASGDMYLEDQEIQSHPKIEIPLYLNGGSNIYSFECLLNFNFEHLIFDRYEFSEDLDHFTIEIKADSGEIKIAGAGTSPGITDMVFANFYFILSENFPEDETTISLTKLRWNENPVLNNVSTAVLSKTVSIIDTKTGVPNKFSLDQNYPNPFNAVTNISFQLPISCNVKISVFDINGNIVETLLNEVKNKGYHSIQWNAVNASTGIYLYRIETQKFNKVIKCVLLK